MVEEQRESRVFEGVPHYTVLEDAAHELGKQVSRAAQQRAAAETAATDRGNAACPPSN